MSTVTAAPQQTVLEQVAGLQRGVGHAQLQNRIGIVGPGLELGQQGGRDAGAAHAGDGLDLAQVGDGHDPGGDRGLDTRRSGLGCRRGCPRAG